eukprot:GHVR01108796.1.p1 GENE.GHVR01108796.1~~GHVR01108796.1.p1  ORF type:complete len:171 (+),score=24.55 GHVR01108796.1:587-1099(+)
MTGARIAVEPSVIEFNSVEPDIRYIQTIYVRNISTKGRRIRFSRPSTSLFRVEAENTVAVAAGLSIPVEVEYYSKEGLDGNDHLVVQCDDLEFVDIPIKARKPRAIFEYNPNLLFGSILELLKLKLIIRGAVLLFNLTLARSRLSHRKNLLKLKCQYLQRRHLVSKRQPS